MLIKKNSGQTVAAQFTVEGELELIKLASRKLQLVTHKENLRLKNVAETTFCQQKANRAQF